MARLAKAWRGLKRKFKTDSGPRLLLELLNWLALIAQAALASYIAWTKRASGELPATLLLLLAIAYAALYKWFLSELFKSKKLVHEEVRRPELVAQALGALAQAADTGSISEAEVQRVEDGALHAIRSEVEKQVGDPESVYLNVTLIVEHPKKSDLLLCINRADRSRKVPREYRKADRLVAECIATGKLVHRPDYKPQTGEKYRSILCYPIVLYGPPEDRVLGAITIDSSVAGHFLDLQDKLRDQFSPALAILTVCLAYRRKLELWPAA